MLNGKIAVVTGASSGIGKAVTELFLKNGCKVIGISKTNKIENLFDFYNFDISDYNSAEKNVQSILEKYEKIDILVNCAGITRDALTYKMTEAQFDEVISTNLKGVWNITKFIGNQMMTQGFGSIINISSIVGVYGNIGQSNYAASKAGLIGMSQSWAKEFTMKGANIRVNVVAPGYTMTKMLDSVPQHLLDKFAQQTLLKRLADPLEIANTVLFLGSDLSSYITGEVINVNGGMRL